MAVVAVARASCGGSGSGCRSSFGRPVVRHRTVLDAVLDALFFLVDVALHVGLHALRDEADCGLPVTSLAGWPPQCRGWSGSARPGRRAFSAFGVSLPSFSARWPACGRPLIPRAQLGGFLRSARHFAQALLDARLLVDVALHGGGGGLREARARAQGQQQGGVSSRVVFMVCLAFFVAFEGRGSPAGA